MHICTPHSGRLTKIWAAGRPLQRAVGVLPFISPHLIEESSTVTRRIIPLACAVALAVTPALAGGKKEGAGESGGSASSGSDTNANMFTGLKGARELIVGPAQASDSLGQVVVTATMWAGSGAAKCRVNFVVENYSSATVALGTVGRTFNAKDEVVDNFVVTVAALPPMGLTGRLFSCTLGATQIALIPTSTFDWPPVKCVPKPDAEPEVCPVTLKIVSTLPVVKK